MTDKEKIPAYLKKAFECPICGTFAEQKWIDSKSIYLGNKNSPVRSVDKALSYCFHCEQTSVWVEDWSETQTHPHYINLDGSYEIPKVPRTAKLVYPDISGIPEPNADMPDDIKKDYDEARAIVNRSPRAASALLRLCVQKLMPHVGGKGKNINADIGDLVKNGLPIEVQQAMDSLRIIGNESVHPGTIDLNDDIETAYALFDLLNYIVDRLITQPKKINEIFTRLPLNKLKGIQDRDK